MRTLAAYLLLISTALAANVVWEPKAPDVAQRTTIDLGGTWAAGETVTPTINNKDVIVTGGSTADTPEEYAAYLVEAITRNEHDDDNTQLDYTINKGGYEFGEFRDVTARIDPDDSTIVWVESAVAGIPFTMTVTETSASGTVTVTSDGTGDSVQATGKHFFNNGENWSIASVPSTDDTIYLRNSSISILFGLDNTAEDLTCIVSPTFTGSVGLPVTNTNSSGNPYTEYRQRFLDLPLTATSGNLDMVVNLSTGHFYVDFGTNDPSSLEVVIESAPTQGPDGASVQIVGGNDLDLVLYEGRASVGEHIGENASNLVAARLLGAGTLEIGSNSTFDDVANTLDINGTGKIVLDADITSSSQEIYVRNGTLMADAGVDLEDVYQYGGTLDFRGTSIENLYGYGGVFNATNNPNVSGTAINNPIESFRGFKFVDPRNVFLGVGIDCNGCRPEDVIQSKINLRWTPTDPGTVDAN